MKGSPNQKLSSSVGSDLVRAQVAERQGVYAGIVKQVELKNQSTDWACE